MYTAIFARSGILTPGLRQNRQWKTAELAGTVPRTPFPGAEPIRPSSDLAVEALFSNPASLRMKVSVLTLTDSDRNLRWVTVDVGIARELYV
jgi:hypothetical protein